MPYSSTTTYGSRVKTYTPGDQIASAELNNMQDRPMAIGDDLADLVDELNDQSAEAQTCTGNQSDSPAPSVGGQKTVWTELDSNGTTEVVIDDSIDWRDRFVHIKGVALAAGSPTLPGSASDHQFDIDLLTSTNKIDHLCYTQEGHDGTVDEPGMSITGVGGLSSDTLRVYADDSDGSLKMRKDADADGQITLICQITCSPDQGHY